MGLKNDLEGEVATIFRSAWSERDGVVVPDADTIKLTNDAVKLTGTVLYADMADSTRMVENSSKHASAESYKAFLLCAAKIIRGEGGKTCGQNALGQLLITKQYTDQVGLGLSVEEIANGSSARKREAKAYSRLFVSSLDLLVARSVSVCFRRKAGTGTHGNDVAASMLSKRRTRGLLIAYARPFNRSIGWPKFPAISCPSTVSYLSIALGLCAENVELESPI